MNHYTIVVYHEIDIGIGMTELFYLAGDVLILLYIFSIISLLLGTLRSPGRVNLWFLDKFVMKKRWSFILLLATFFFAQEIHAFFWRNTNWSPSGLSSENVIGIWHKETDEIVIDVNGSAYYKFDHVETIRNSRFEPQKLIWHLNGNLLYINTESGTEVFLGKIIIFDNEYMILDQYDEGQKWLRSLGFKRIK